MLRIIYIFNATMMWIYILVRSINAIKQDTNLSPSIEFWSF